MVKVSSTMKTEIEVLKNEVANIKEQNTVDHSNIIREICGIKDDIAEAMKSKADKSEVGDLKSNMKAMWTFVAAVLSLVVGYMIYINQAFLQHLNK